MPATIRPMQLQDYTPAAALYRLAYPEQPDQAETWAHADRDGPAATEPRRWVAVEPDSGTLIGYGAIWHVRLNKYRMDLVVHPEQRRLRTGTRMLSALLSVLRARGAETVQARTDAQNDAALQFLKLAGFVETQRMQELVLRLDEARTDGTSALLERLQPAGITVGTLAEETERELHIWEKLAALQNAVAPTWPDPDQGPIEPQTADAFRHKLIGWPVIPRAFFIATHGDQPVGYSGLATPARTGEPVESAGTAVHPAYRGRGIAGALKALCLLYAQEHGYTQAVTHSANPAMVHINETFGFRPTRVEVRLVKRL